MRNSSGFTLLAVTALLLMGRPSQATDPVDLYYQVWWSSVEALASADEERAYRELDTPHERETFIHQFWRNRDPTPATGRNELREWWADEGRGQAVSLVEGDPREGVFASLGSDVPRIHRFEGCHPLADLEVWSLDAQALVFIRKVNASLSASPLYRAWAADRALSDLVSDASVHSAEDLLARSRRACVRHETAWRALEVALSEAIDPRTLEAPMWSELGLERQGADRPERVEAELKASFLGAVGESTVVRGLLELSAVALEERGPTARTAVRLEGQIVRGAELADRFVVHYHHPLDVADGAKVPLSFQRRLAPGSYLLAMRLEDASGEPLWQGIRAIEVPAAEARLELPRASLKLLRARVLELFPATGGMEILAPGLGLQVGEVEIETAVMDPEIAEVRFLLDGRAVGRVSEPPFVMALDLGPEPRQHEVAVTGLDRRGAVLARDRLRLNAGPHRLAVRLIEPMPGSDPNGSVLARAVVSQPPGSELRAVEFFVGNELVAVARDAPLARELPVSRGDDVEFVRVVAHLADGRSAEDLVVLRGPDVMDEITVDLVELFVTVSDRNGRVVSDLSAEDFLILDENAEQKVGRFERVKNLPIHVGLLLDASASMAPALEVVEETAIGFIEKVLSPRDQAALIAFDHRTSLLSDFTHDRAVLAAKVRELTATGGTAIWDSLVLSLYQFGGLEGRRALVLLSDGKDEHSDFEFETALDYARRTGVAVYPIALDRPQRGGVSVATSAAVANSVTTIGPGGRSMGRSSVRRGLDARHAARLRELANETGGRFVRISRIEELDAILTGLAHELRSQYLLAYHAPSESEAGFRRVKVEMTSRGLKARTSRGYYRD